MSIGKALHIPLGQMVFDASEHIPFRETGTVLVSWAVFYVGESSDF